MSVVKTFTPMITGEYITEKIRDLWQSNCVKEIFNIIKNGFTADFSDNDILDICIGNKKICGNSNESFYIDNDNSCDDYFTIEWQIENLEKNLLNYSNSLNASQRNLLIQSGVFDYESAVYRCGSLNFTLKIKSQQSKDEEIIKKCEEKIKDIVDSLQILYPLVNKDLKELANIFIKSGTQLSNVEIQNREHRFLEIENNRNRLKKESEQRKLQSKIKKVNKLYDKEIDIPEKENILYCYNGILDVDGNFYECMYQEHNGLLENLTICVKEGLITLKNISHKNIGFIKLQNGVFYPFVDFGYEYRWVTKEQEDKMLKYFTESENKKIGYKHHIFETIEDLRYLLTAERNGKNIDDILSEIKSDKNKKLIDKESKELEKIKKRNIKDLKKL